MPPDTPDPDVTTAIKSGRPRHQQVSDWLLRQIRGGILAPHDRLPSEHELTKLFGVSRVTVRRALATLEKDDLIYRHQGLGSFVAPAKLPQGLVRLTDFTQDMQRAGLSAASRVLAREPEKADGHVARALEIEIGDPVFRIDRLRLGDDKVIAFDRTWLPPFYAQLVEGHDLAECTIYSILEKRYEIPVRRGKYRIESVAADEEIARILEVKAGAPLLRIVRLSYTIGDRLVYYQSRYYRSDRVALELELERDTNLQDGDRQGMPLRELAPVFH